MSKRKIVYVSVVLLVVGFIIHYIYNVNYETRGVINNFVNELEGKTFDKELDVKIKSGNLTTDYTVEQVLEDIEKFNLNTINLPIVIEIDTLTSNDMRIYENSLERAKWLLDKIKWSGVNVILEPYPWIANGSEYETKLNPQNREEFFYNWKTKVLKPLIDEIAIPYRVDVLNVATSFTMLEDSEEQFCDMIDYARQYYKGLITYRTSFWITANWDNTETDNQEEVLRLAYEKKLNNRLFSKLDFISVAAYFELTDNPTNTLDNLVNAINVSQRYNRKQPIKEEIQAFYDKWNKPIFFGELGFPITENASVEPWNPYQTTVINGQEQANCFEAYRRAYENEPWMLGFSVFAIGNKDSDKMYYPSEETTQIIRRWYKSENK